MRVAVVMTTFNGAPFVEEQARSIAAQTRPVDEVLVYDDGSTDGTVDLVRRLLPSAVVTVNTTRLGTVRSLEQGLRATTADVVLLADQDDVWRPERVASVLGVGADAVFSDASLVPGGGSLWDAVGFDPRRQQRFAADPVGVLLEGNPVTGATLTVSRDLLEVALPLPAQGWHDYWLVLVAAVTGRRVVPLSHQLLDYRLHSANTAGLPPTGVRARLTAGPAARAQRVALIGMLTELHGRFPDARVAAARDHLVVRQSLHPRRGRRAVPVVRHLLQGAYAAHGGGLRTALVDLLESHGRD